MYFPPKVLMAARLLLGISRKELAEASKISFRTLSNFESEMPGTTLKTMEAVQSALISHYGVQFLPEDENNGYGIRFPLGHFSDPKNRQRTPRKSKSKTPGQSA